MFALTFLGTTVMLISTLIGSLRFGCFALLTEWETDSLFLLSASDPGNNTTTSSRVSQLSLSLYLSFSDERYIRDSFISVSNSSIGFNNIISWTTLLQLLWIVVGLYEWLIEWKSNAYLCLFDASSSFWVSKWHSLVSFSMSWFCEWIIPSNSATVATVTDSQL